MTTKQQKLRDDLEQKILHLKEAWKSFEKERDAPKPELGSPEMSDRLTVLVKLVMEVISKSNDTLSAYSVYTATLEKKLGIVPKKHDSKRKKESL